MKSKTILNIASSLLLQAVTVICGFITPRLLLVTFGSEVNGLVSSITQFLNYISLLEGGLTGVMMAALYRPLYERDEKKVSSIFAAMDRFYRRIGLIFLLYQTAIAVFYPFFTDSSFSWLYISSLVMIIGIGLFIQYNFSLSYKILLSADSKVYIVSLIQALIVTLNTAAVYVGIRLYPNIHLIKLATSLLFLLQPLGYRYFTKKYFHLDQKAVPDSAAVSQRWDGFGINIAAFIHNNTDIVVLTLLTTLKTVSVYSVYFLVAAGLKQIVLAISSGVNPTAGRAIVTDNEKELNRKFDVIENLYMLVVFVLFASGIVLIVPFIMLYTHSITDTNYRQPLFAVLLMLAECMFCMREPYNVMIYQAGHFRQISKYAYVEAALNIVLSVIFVFRWGLVGVTIGTLISMTYRTVCNVFYLRKNILRRSASTFFRYLFVFTAGLLLLVLLCSRILPVQIDTVFQWILSGVVTVPLSIGIFAGLSFALLPHQSRRAVSYLSHKIQGFRK